MNTPLIDGPRACTRAELPEVIALVDSELGRHGTGQTLLTDYPLVYQDGNLGNIRILKVGAELASVVPFIAWPMMIEDCHCTVGIISPTATAVAHRRKGYGLRCLNDCLALMAKGGCEISALWTEVATFPFYENADYQAVRHQIWTYLCTPADAKLFSDHGEEILTYDPGTQRHLEAMHRMHEQESFRIGRSALQCARLFGLPKMKTLLALRRGEPVAYLVASKAINKPGLLEAGGEAPAVETLVHHALAKLKDGDSYTAHASRTESVMGGLFQRTLAERRRPTVDNRMMRINQPTAFFHGMARWLGTQNRGVESAFSLGIEGETISFQFARNGLNLGTARLGRHFDLSRRELSAVVFGRHPTSPAGPADQLGGVLACPSPIWLLDQS